MNKYIIKNGLKFLPGFVPGEDFRFEEGVSIGRCEIARSVSFGAYSYMNSGFVRTYTVIGRFCSIGRNVTLGSGIHDPDVLSTSPFFMKNSKPSPMKWANKEKKIRVLIGNDVWIGDNAYVMSGVTVGNGAVIAAGACVTKDVPPYSIVAGIPARHLKWRFPLEIIERLENLRWFELSFEYLKNADVGNILQCLALLESLPDSYRSKKNISYKKLS